MARKCSGKQDYRQVIKLIKGTSKPCIETKQLRIPQGEIVGRICKTVYKNFYFSFEGIPYAKPPMDELRFRAPEPAESWQGVRDCTKPGDAPLQMDYFSQEVFGSEDCLYLNVYVKTLYSPAKLPVLVYFYGGRFMGGYANREKYSPEYFMMKHVVIVTFNYRVGVFGFLTMCNPDLNIPGNAGLKDMVLALKWVKDNIEYFNGDPDNITLFGESAGAAAVHFMLNTPQTKKLFQKAILQSGSMFNPWAYKPQSDMPYHLALLKGYTGPNYDSDILEFLNGVDGVDLIENLFDEETNNDIGMFQPFAPTIEPYETEHCIISKPYEEAVKTSWSLHIPVIIGGNSFEGLIFYLFLKRYPEQYKLLQSDPQLLLPFTLQGNMKAERKVQAIKSIIKTFFCNENAKSSDDKILKYLDVFSTRYFWHGIYQAIELRMHHGKAPTYVYRFDFDSPNYGFRRMLFTDNKIKEGVAHADDLQYLFHYHKGRKLPKNSPEYKTIRRMIGMWTAFAETSDPNCEEIEPDIWHRTKPQEPFMCLNISKQLEMIELPEKEKIQVWKSLFKYVPECE